MNREAIAACLADMAAVQLPAVLQALWRPIEIAPKSVMVDGSVRGVYLLGFEPAHPDDEPYGDPQVGIHVVWWEPKVRARNGDVGCWYDGDMQRFPTRWMPLPRAPQPGRG